MYAVIRIRGSVNVNHKVEDTMKMIHLNRINHCVLLDENPHYKGMLQKAKDYIAWGDVDQEMIEMLLTNRGRLEGGTRLTDEYVKNNTNYDSISKLAGAVHEGKASFNDVPKLKPIFRLHPPRKGHSGIKKTYKEGGELGYHGTDINNLIKKMR